MFFSPSFSLCSTKPDTMKVIRWFKKPSLNSKKLTMSFPFSTAPPRAITQQTSSSALSLSCPKQLIYITSMVRSWRMALKDKGSSFLVTWKEMVSLFTMIIMVSLNHDTKCLVIRFKTFLFRWFVSCKTS